MSFIIRTEDKTDHLSPDFLPVAQKLAELDECYKLAKHSAQITRMELIGLAEEHKRLYPQRSAEARFIHQGYKDNEWSDTIVYRSHKAYLFREKLLEKGIQIFTDLATESTFTQLYELACADEAALSGDNTVNSSTVYDAAKFLASTKKVPSQKQIIGHKTKRTNSKFEFYQTLHAEKKRMTQDDESESGSGAKLNSESEFCGTAGLETETRTLCSTIKVKEVKEDREEVREDLTTLNPELKSLKPDSALPSSEVASVSDSVVYQPNSQVVDVDSFDVDTSETVSPDFLSHFKRLPVKDLFKAMEDYVRINRKNWTREEKDKLEMMSSMIRSYIGKSDRR